MIDSSLIKEELRYTIGYSANNDRIRRILLNENDNLCSYSTKKVLPDDSVDLDHFDNDKGKSDYDSYRNYFIVLKKYHQFKKDPIKGYLPIIRPDDQELPTHIELIYDTMMYAYYSNKGENLIKYLDLNNKIAIEARTVYKKLLENLYFDKKWSLEEIKDLPIYYDSVYIAFKKNAIHPHTTST